MWNSERHRRKRKGIKEIKFYKKIRKQPMKKPRNLNNSKKLHHPKNLKTLMKKNGLQSMMKHIHPKKFLQRSLMMSIMICELLLSFIWLIDDFNHSIRLYNLMLPSPAPDKYILSMIIEELEIVWNYLEDLPTSTKPKKSKEYSIKYFGDSTNILLVFVAVMVASEVPRLNEANKSTVVHSICLHSILLGWTN